MKIIAGLLLIFAFLPVRAQTIKGKICNDKDKSPVQFASIALLQLPDSSMITGVISLTDGSYAIEKVKPGDYFIKASFVGFRPSGKPVSVTEGQAETIIDTIFLAESMATLNEVTVIGERLKGEEMVDRTVYKIPEVIAKASSNGYDILKKIPQVNVDFQNNITLNGSSNFIIQVDGRQRDREFLARLLPSDIQSIEIISNPSGKYEGNIDGVISIILRKEARFGMSGNVAMSLKPFNKITSAATGSLDYSVGKLTFYATGVLITQELDIFSTGENRFLAIDSMAKINGKGMVDVKMPSLNTGFDYYMNDKSNMSFNVSYKPVNQNVEMQTGTVLLKNQIPLDLVSSVTGNAVNSHEASASLFYKRTFRKPVKEFSSEVSYYAFRSLTQNDFTNERYSMTDGELVSEYSRFEDDINRRNYLSGKLDFVYPLGMYSKIETGYQVYYQQMGYDFTIENQEGTNLFEYAELRNSGYAGSPSI